MIYREEDGESEISMRKILWLEELMLNLHFGMAVRLSRTSFQSFNLRKNQEYNVK